MSEKIIRDGLLRWFNNSLTFTGKAALFYRNMQIADKKMYEA